MRRREGRKEDRRNSGMRVKLEKADEASGGKERRTREAYREIRREEREGDKKDG